MVTIVVATTPTVQRKSKNIIDNSKRFTHVRRFLFGCNYVSNAIKVQ